jgi:hypothetical protein
MDIGSTSIPIGTGAYFFWAVLEHQYKVEARIEDGVPSFREPHLLSSDVVYRRELIRRSVNKVNWERKLLYRPQS